MIDAQPSLRAAEGLSGSEVAAYLLSKGWAASPSRVKGFSIFSKKIEGPDELIEIVLPITKGFDEEQRRIADALRTIGGIEKLPVASIADEIRHFKDAKDDTRRSDLERVVIERIALPIVENGDINSAIFAISDPPEQESSALERGAKYRRYAVECQKASAQATPKARADLLAIAQMWTALADVVERGSRNARQEGEGAARFWIDLAEVVERNS